MNGIKVGQFSSQKRLRQKKRITISFLCIFLANRTPYHNKLPKNINQKLVKREHSSESLRSLFFNI